MVLHVDGGGGAPLLPLRRVDAEPESFGHRGKRGGTVAIFGRKFPGFLEGIGRRKELGAVEGKKGVLRFFQHMGSTGNPRRHVGPHKSEALGHVETAVGISENVDAMGFAHHVALQREVGMSFSILFHRSVEPLLGVLRGVFRGGKGPVDLVPDGHQGVFFCDVDRHGTGGSGVGHLELPRKQIPPNIHQGDEMVLPRLQAQLSSSGFRRQVRKGGGFVEKSRNAAGAGEIRKLEIGSGRRMVGRHSVGDGPVFCSQASGNIPLDLNNLGHIAIPHLKGVIRGLVRHRRRGEEHPPRKGPGAAFHPGGPHRKAESTRNAQGHVLVSQRGLDAPHIGVGGVVPLADLPPGLGGHPVHPHGVHPFGGSLFDDDLDALAVPDGVELVVLHLDVEIALVALHGHQFQMADFLSLDQFPAVQIDAKISIVGIAGALEGTVDELGEPVDFEVPLVVEVVRVPPHVLHFGDGTVERSHFVQEGIDFVHPKLQFLVQRRSKFFVVRGHFFHQRRHGLGFLEEVFLVGRTVRLFFHLLHGRPEGIHGRPKSLTRCGRHILRRFEVRIGLVHEDFDVMKHFGDLVPESLGGGFLIVLGIQKLVAHALDGIHAHPRADLPRKTRTVQSRIGEGVCGGHVHPLPGISLHGGIGNVVSCGLHALAEIGQSPATHFQGEKAAQHASNLL